MATDDHLDTYDGHLDSDASAFLADGGQFDSGRLTNDVELLAVCGNLECGQLTDDRCITR